MRSTLWSLITFDEASRERSTRVPILTPFTRRNRDNMIAWLAARCDFPDYGKMLFYELPKEKLIYGPNQISAMIDQSTTFLNNSRCGTKKDQM